MITFGYSVVRIAHFDYTFSALFELKASPVVGHLLQQMDKKRRKRKYEKKKKLMESLKTLLFLPKNFYFHACPSKNA